MANVAPLTARTESEVVADVVAQLALGGFLKSTTRDALADAARSVGVTPRALGDALLRRRRLPYVAPSPLRVVTVQHEPEPERPAPKMLVAAPRRDRPTRRKAAPALLNRRLCCRCKEWKPFDAFDVKDRRTGALRSMCRPCLSDYQRTRYLTVAKLAALEALGIDPAQVGATTCACCGEPIGAGPWVVEGVAALRHRACSPGEAPPTVDHALRFDPAEFAAGLVEAARQHPDGL